MTVIDGSEWLETPCKKCRCVNSVITCWAVTPVCPPPPEPHCIELPGECCPTYDCTKPQYVYISLCSLSSQGSDICKLRGCYSWCIQTWPCTKQNTWQVVFAWLSIWTRLDPLGLGRCGVGTGIDGVLLQGVRGFSGCRARGGRVLHRPTGTLCPGWVHCLRNHQTAHLSSSTSSPSPLYGGHHTWPMLPHLGLQVRNIFRCV